MCSPNPSPLLFTSETKHLYVHKLAPRVFFSDPGRQGTGGQGPQGPRPANRITCPRQEGVPVVVHVCLSVCLKALNCPRQRHVRAPQDLHQQRLRCTLLRCLRLLFARVLQHGGPWRQPASTPHQQPLPGIRSEDSVLLRPPWSPGAPAHHQENMFNAHTTCLALHTAPRLMCPPPVLTHTTHTSMHATHKRARDTSTHATQARTRNKQQGTTGCHSKDTVHLPRQRHWC